MNHNSQAIETMKRELTRINIAMSDCITDSGFVRNECRYRYQELMQKAKAFKESIEWLEGMYTGKKAMV